MALIVFQNQSIYLVNSLENESAPSTVTQYPVEQGAPTSDHIRTEQVNLSVSGFLLGDTAEKDFLTLVKWKNEGALLSYKGRVYYTRTLISDISKNYSNISNGFGITLTFTPIRIVNTSWEKIPNNGKKQPTPAKSKEVYVTVKKGNTYWSWWQQYGTSIQTLRNWNKWPDRFIPIGARARVK